MYYCSLIFRKFSPLDTPFDDQIIQQQTLPTYKIVRTHFSHFSSLCEYLFLYNCLRHRFLFSIHYYFSRSGRANQRMFSSNVWKKSFDAVKNTDNSRNVIQRECWMLDICHSWIENRPHDATHYQPSSVGGCS
jgi:hypothetical protein